MILSPTAQATLLLTSYFSKASSDDVKPLTNAEWGRFALWLKSKSITPADLLVPDPKPLLNGWSDLKVDSDRIVQLLSRGHSLALAVEKWQRAGLWVVTRSDPEYPWRLKQRLKTDSPPVLFGCGNKALLNASGLAVIGSRNASEADLAFTGEVGVKAAVNGIAIVSGGARGVDETAMLGAMHSRGPVIGIMADSLLKAATSAKWRRGLMDGHVVLVSPFYPEAGFNAGNAMARNKYIYCLADTSLVIHSGKKGGTLSGAEENLKKRWVPLWVKPTNDKDSANADLVNKGGRWCESDIYQLNVRELFSTASDIELQVKEEQPDLFSIPAQTDLFAEPEPEPEPSTPLLANSSEETNEFVEQRVAKNQDLNIPDDQQYDFYSIFINVLPSLAEEPITLEALIEKTCLHKTQLNEWLHRASDDGVVKKLNRPTRYQFIGHK